MTRTQGLLVVLTCVLLAAWLAGGRRLAVARQSPGVPLVPALAVDPAIETIAGQALRLRAHLASPAPLAPSRRNPFRFHEVTPADPSSRKGASGPGGELAERPARPEMTLVGIAADIENGTTQRTAIVSAMGQLFLLKEGERLLARYQVVRIADDAVQVKDGDETFTLALR